MPGPSPKSVDTIGPFHPLTRVALAIIACTFLAATAPAQAAWKQQGPKLVPNNLISQGAHFGWSVSLSGDGSTAIMGAPTDNNNVGASWIYTRNGGAWTQGPKLLASDAAGPPMQGYSVSMSTDGNTAIVGGWNDNSTKGAAWIYIRSNGVWTQQGPKLVGTGATGGAEQGWSVAISADGNTAIVGGPADSSQAGAAWIFTRTNGVWAQQGSKLVGTGATGAAQQGWSVAISADGNTALLGAQADNAQAGATWVFTRSNGVWAQQGSKLVGSDAVAAAQQGSSVAVSADGSAAIVGGWADNHGFGAAWSFTRSNGVWTQQGPKLQASGGNVGISVALSGAGDVAILGQGSTGAFVFTLQNGTWSQVGTNLFGYGNSGFAEEGKVVALSADASTVLSAGPIDNNTTGAVWPFNRFGWHDFNADWKADILWRATGGDAAIWFMNGPQIASTTSLGTIPTAWSIVGTGDFDGDGHDDILWRNTGGDLAIWLMSGGQILSGIGLGNVPTAWTVAGVGDFDGDGKADILWRNTGGDATIWFMNGGQIVSGQSIGNLSTAWSVVGVADFDGNRKADILWRDTQGNVAIWYMNGGQIGSTASYGVVPLAWTVAGARDFDADGQADILWRNTTGDVTLWFMSGGQIKSGQSLGNVPTNWSVVQTADFNGDDKSDILWRSTSGDLSMWLMNGGQIVSMSQLGNVPTVWSVQNVNAN